MTQFPMAYFYFNTCLSQQVMSVKVFDLFLNPFTLIMSSLPWPSSHCLTSDPSLFSNSQVRVGRAGEECVSRLRQRQWCPWGAQARLRWRADGRCPPQEVRGHIVISPLRNTAQGMTCGVMWYIKVSIFYFHGFFQFMKASKQLSSQNKMVLWWSF